MVGCIVHSTPSDCVERWRTSVRKQIRWTGILLSGSSAINPIMYENMPRHLDAGLSAFILMISTSETIDSSLCVGNLKTSVERRLVLTCDVQGEKAPSLLSCSALARRADNRG